MTVTQVALVQRTGLLPPLNPVLATCRSAIFLIPAMILESRYVPPSYHEGSHAAMGLTL
jgi:hypothetical protein